jgi:2-amino-4-hydroxy-6-hydroxymethyldihydropteridine diphosphokinase
MGNAVWTGDSTGGCRFAESGMNQLAIIALGSNLGDPLTNVRRAMDRLQAMSNHTILRSSLWCSAPQDCPPGSPDFINAVVMLVTRTGETPETLLLKLQFLETQFGRERGSEPNIPRALDLDLIAFGAVALKRPELTLPHPRAHQRRFVLAPLAELAPNLILPGFVDTVGRQLLALPEDGKLERIR